MACGTETEKFSCLMIMEPTFKFLYLRKKKKKSLGVKDIAILNILLYLTDSNADTVSDHNQMKTSTV